MKKAIMCSLCHNGVLGGTLYFENQSITYKTNKLTVDKKYRNLLMPLSDIKDIVWSKKVFPIATIYMKNEDKYTFLIFDKNAFDKYYNEMMKDI